MPENQDLRSSDGCLVYTDKGWKSILGGLFLLAFGILCFWLARLRPGEENGWVPWVVGALFSGVGVFTVFGRAKTVFDGATRTWSDSWGILFLSFSQSGSFDKLDRIVVEESVIEGFTRYYIWVKGGRNIRLLPETTHSKAEAKRVAGDLRALLALPVKETSDD